MGQLDSIVYKPTGAASTGDAYVRVVLDDATLIVGHGIEGDTKGGGKGRHLNVMAAATVQALGHEGFRAGPGRLGEQLIVSGVDIDALPPGARLRIGPSACIEVTEPRTGCGKFEQHQSKQKEEAAGRLGMMARVVESGAIRTGDPVTVIGTAGAKL